MGKERHSVRKDAEKRGRQSELLAALLLRCKGYRILGQRVRTHAGEIDLVARNLAGVVCFIEVKARPDEGLAAEAVGPRQRARIVRAAELFLARKPAPKGVRFDVMTVVPGRLPRHLRDAWRADSL
ncbi:MAG: YraN family protein [Alphaproteobacteria bacterium]|nr:YraN family protein [Alphaproteobacteria bacterium]MDE1986879.1 YraN family protein [Alphaproteobacteria bacterium]MDE2161642.1 YraN family protein [Alphaproteobacteria bacterium]